MNYCPDPPEGQSPENMEEKRKIMEAEMLKKDPDHQLVEDLMVATFSHRRKEMIGAQPLITDVLSRWPALFHERQVITQLCINCAKRYIYVPLSVLLKYILCTTQIKAEFRRIVNTDLLESFLDGLDGLVPRLLELYKAAARSGKKKTLKDILDCLGKDVSG